MVLNNWFDVVALSQRKCITPILGDLKYGGCDNFLGRPVSGYQPDARDVCLMTKQAAFSLCEVQDYLFQKHQMGLAIYDSFRPLRALRDFAVWAGQPLSGEIELTRKRLHYPDLDKNQLASLGYLGITISQHCFGNAVDLVLVALPDRREIAMGSIFDYFGEISHATASAEILGHAAYKHRRLLIDAMKLHHFTVYEKEYWHFEHNVREIEEPSDFEITRELKGLGI